jgi:hypothetical protein
MCVAKNSMLETMRAFPTAKQKNIQKEESYLNRV